MKTRKQLCRILKVSNPTLRRILRVLDIHPQDISFTSHNVPVFLYSQQECQRLGLYLQQARAQQARRRQAGLLRCRGGCNRYYKKQELTGSRICKDCRNNKQLLNIAYDKQPWKRILDIPAIDKAINFLKKLKNSSKKAENTFDK